MFVAKNYNVTSWQNYCINCTSSVCFAMSFMQLRNDPKCIKILRNGPKHLFRVQWGGLVAFVAKNLIVTSWHELLYEVQYVLQQVSCSYKTIPNAPKDNETDRIISLGSNGVDLVRSLRKIPTSLRGTNFCINCTSSPRFAPSFM